ncbi:MAG: cytochrome b [Beijerinckiaceae bacterium]|nr:cytochrome b [Beijerinckiaceae bacterium]
METRRYDLFSQLLHWLIAVLVVATYVMALVREELPRGALRNDMLSYHMAIGVLVFALTLVRLGWRTVHLPPPPVSASALMNLAAKAGHLALYLSLIAIPLIGLFSAWAAGRNVSFIGLFSLPPLIAPSRGVVKILEEAHEISAHAMMAFAGLHAAAAIVHQFVLRDGTLMRMLPAGGGAHRG